MALGKLLGNTAGYAASGLAAGAPFGPAGAGVGALAGGTLGLLRSILGGDKKPAISAQQITNQPSGNFLTGYTGYNQQLPTRSPEQVSSVNQLLQPTVNRLGSNQQDIEPIIEKSRQDFRKFTTPSLASRFTALGNENTPAAQYALSNAAAEHEAGLAGLRAQYGLQQRGLDQNLLQQLLQPQFETQTTPAQPGVAQGISDYALPGVSDFATKYLSDLLSNPATSSNQLGGSGTSTQNANQNNHQPSFGNKALQAGGTALTGALVTELINYLLSK